MVDFAIVVKCLAEVKISYFLLILLCCFFFFFTLVNLPCSLLRSYPWSFVLTSSLAFFRSLSFAPSSYWPGKRHWNYVSTGGVHMLFSWPSTSARWVAGRPNLTGGCWTHAAISSSDTVFFTEQPFHLYRYSPLKSVIGRDWRCDNVSLSFLGEPD